MAENIVGGLFGVDPQQLQQQRQTMDTTNAFRFAQLTPMERAQMAIYQGGAGLARGVGGLLGGDVEMEKASKIQQLAGQFDLSTPEGAREFGRALQPFAPVESMKALTKADNMEQMRLTRQKTQGDINKAELSAANEEKLRKELSTLPANATEQQVIEVVRKYGSPDKVLQILTQSQDRQAALEQRRATADLASATREGTRSAKQMLADEKLQDKRDKQEQSANAAISGADRIIQEVGEAKDKVSGFTAGLGSYLSVLPLTEAKDLSKRLTTIKANLGFDRLQQMRDASPTGGALGQVAVQELVALQSTIASLDQDQSPAQLKQSLDKIEKSYANWRDTVRKAGKATVGSESARGNEVDFNSLPKRK